MEFRAKQIAPPKNWERFEDLCHALFKAVWADPLAQKHGRRGQAQQGVDVFGSPDAERSRFYGVQCKGKDTNYGGLVTCDELVAEIEKADSFSPKLGHWILATTAPVDAALQRAARELSAERAKQDLFTVTVLGWEELQALMADAPGVVEEFYPEAAFDLPALLRELKTIAAKVAAVDSDAPALGAATHSRTEASSHGQAVWLPITFDKHRDLGPALMGRALGPADAATCPRLPEADVLVLQLRNAFSTRLVGIPGAGKSVCGYQAALKLAEEGWAVLRLVDPEAADIGLVRQEAPTLFLIDDAHLIEPSALSRLEESAHASAMLLSIHNAVERQGIVRGTVVLDPERAVKTIAKALRADRARTLEAVRRADDQVGEHMMDSSLEERIDHAEGASSLPWQFCFILGGGWRRAKLAADNARLAGADFVLAVLAMRQIVSRDAIASEAEIAEICRSEGLNSVAVSKALKWLAAERLILSLSDCRTPHQRFAAVAMHQILIGRDSEGRRAIYRVAEGLLCDVRHPLAGLRNLLHEYRFGHGDYRWSWSKPFQSTTVHRIADRCWEAETDEERNFAALVLTELESFIDDWTKALIDPMKVRFAEWIASPRMAAYGLGSLLNSLRQPDDALRKEIVSLVDPGKLAEVFSAVSPGDAYGLCDLMRSAFFYNPPDWQAAFSKALARDKFLAIATTWTDPDQAFLFARVCYTVAWFDRTLGLDMAEAYIPTAHMVLVADPMGGFRGLDDIVTGTLRVFDVLGVFIGKLKADARCWKIARRMCSELDADRLAAQLSDVRPRNFQQAAFFLSFLSTCAPEKFDAVVVRLDWGKLAETIGADWANLQHEAEVLIGVLSVGKSQRWRVARFIMENAHRIEKFPPRLALISPEIAIEHLNAGRQVRLVHYAYVEWDYGAVLVEMLADNRPGLLTTFLAPHEEGIAKGLSGQNASWFAESGPFLNALREHAPGHLSSILAQVDVLAASKGWTDSLQKAGTARAAVAILVDVANDEPGEIGALGQKLRKRFPIASLPEGKPKPRRRDQTRRRRK